MQPWQVLSRQLIHDGMPWVRLSTEHVRLPNGAEIPDYYRIEITPYASIFAMTEDQQVMLVEHYKHGPQMMSIEPPAGYIDNNDDPLETARRELREETGLVSHNWRSLGRYFIDGNRGCGWMYGFVALGARLEGDPELESTEIMRQCFMPLADVYELWRSGGIQNASAVALIGRALVEIGYLRATNGRE